MQRYLSIVVLTQNQGFKLTTHTRQTSLRTSNPIDFEVHAKINDFLNEVIANWSERGEKVLSISHSIFA